VTAASPSALVTIVAVLVFVLVALTEVVVVVFV
jgi:hypothetical protein